VHRDYFDANAVQLSTLLSIKTGGCEEDCKYCSQSSHFDTGLKAEKLIPLAEVVAAAKTAKSSGATRFCMGAAWRSPKPRHLEALGEMVREVKALGLETCLTAGMLETGQAEQLRDAGLIVQLANLDPYPESVPINNLVRIEGTPLAQEQELDPFEFVRTIAVARITMPRAMVRLSAGREAMPEALQALCFMAGANSMFYGDKLLTTSNPQAQADQKLLQRLNIRTSTEENLVTKATACS